MKHLFVRSALAALLGASAIGCSESSAASGPASPSPVIIDQSGVGMKGALVRNEHKWVITSAFNEPSGPWGVTYSYRCTHGGDFWVAVAQTDIDGINPLTVIYRKARQGRGYKMETGKVKPQSLPPIADSPGISTNLQTLQIDSRCLWHVRVVVGSRSVLKQNVPPLP